MVWDVDSSSHEHLADVWKCRQRSECYVLDFHAFAYTKPIRCH